MFGSKTTTTAPFIFGASVQSASNAHPFGNVPTSTSTANTTNTGFAGSGIFGVNQTGVTSKFAPAPAPAIFPTPSTTSNIFGGNNAGIINPFDTTKSNTSGNLINQTLPASSINPFTIGTTTAPTVNIFGTSNPMTASPFRPLTPAVTQNIAPTATTMNPFAIKPATTQSPFTISTPFVFQPQSTTATSSITTAPTSTIAPAPTFVNPWGIQQTGANIFNVPTSTTAPAPTFVNPWGIQQTGANIFNVPTSAPAPTFVNPWSIQKTGANIFNVPTSATATVPTITSTFPAFTPVVTTTTNTSGVPAATSTTTTPFSTFNNIGTQNTVPTTTTASTLNPQLHTGLPVSQTQPQIQAQNIHQRFLAASLVDPYVNPGRKDFHNIDQIQSSSITGPHVVSTSSATTTTTAVITSAPITIPIQSNSRKASPSRSLLDVNFKLKPVSSSPTLNEDVKSSNQQSVLSTGRVNSPLRANFTDEEELVLLSRNKMSKLRISNDVIQSSLQSETIRSLYPIKRLDELEKLPNMTVPSSSSTINNNQRSNSSNENRETSPIRHPSPSNTPKQSSVQCNSNPYHLPILTRDDYYMKPTLSELKSLFNDKGQCIVKQLTVGHEKYGSVTFYGNINVAGLNLDEIIKINRHEVIVYPDDNNKPSVGEELNLPARITLIGVYPIDRTTREEITDTERIKAMNYNEYLSEITKKFDGEFIRYGIKDGAWTFMVKHFTRYGLDREDLYIPHLQGHQKC